MLKIIKIQSGLGINGLFWGLICKFCSTNCDINTKTIGVTVIDPSFCKIHQFSCEHVGFDI